MQSWVSSFEPVPFAFGALFSNVELLKEKSLWCPKLFTASSACLVVVFSLRHLSVVCYTY